jgi:hypothetical protein
VVGSLELDVLIAAKLTCKEASCQPTSLGAEYGSVYDVTFDRKLLYCVPDASMSSAILPKHTDATRTSLPVLSLDTWSLLKSLTNHGYTILPLPHTRVYDSDQKAVIAKEMIIWFTSFL